MENRVRMEKYADLIVQTAVNVQKDQTLVINAPIEAADFVRLVVNRAYLNGARNVHVEWSDEQVTKMKMELAPEAALSEFPMWKAKGLEEMAENGAAFLTIYAPNPDLLKDVNPKRVALATKASASALEGYRDYIKKDKVSWTIASVPTEKWAEKIFTTMGTKEACEKLWDVIFNVTRVNEEDPLQAWKIHKEALINKVDVLNEKKYKYLHYKGPGTDLTIELPKGHIWSGAATTNEKGTSFIPNVPTEEVFTLPHKNGVNGTVASTKPLNYNGNIINNFTLTFKDGKIIDFAAEEGHDTLQQLIETDEGSHYLGEVALVPHDSPISNSGIIFYNTLFDENASCHLAIGSAYPFCLEGGTKMTKEELETSGANTSLTHVDFMMGASELNINGETEDGKIEPIFVNGNWAF